MLSGKYTGGFCNRLSGIRREVTSEVPLRRGGSDKSGQSGARDKLETCLKVRQPVKWKEEREEWGSPSSFSSDNYDTKYQAGRQI